MLTREYEVRGASPLGPVCPGAGLFPMTGDGTGAVAAAPVDGSAVPDPTDSESFVHSTATHHQSTLQL